MANEYLRRTPTSTGNRRVWTWSYWIKKNALGGQITFYTTQVSTPYLSVLEFQDDNRILVTRNESATATELFTTNTFRDVGNWMHIIAVFNTVSSTQTDRVKLYVNGVLQSSFTGTYPPVNYEGGVNRTVEHDIGAVVTGAYPNGFPGSFMEGELADIFFVDGQALTPDVFGFYKQGKGYISAGSTQATDFRPGQWVPKTPRVIKTEINRRGGFGVNGFYLPMNDSNNFGADFHGEPNSIITLNEKLPQPRVGVATTASVGLGYTDALRDDPYKANLVLALPFVSGGLSSGFGDYAPSIKGSGSAKTVTANGSVSIASTAGYYGSAASFNGADATNISLGTNSDYNFGTGDWTVEFWFNTNITGRQRLVSTTQGAFGSNTWVLRLEPSNNLTFYTNTTISGAVATARQWNHAAVVRKGTNTSLFLNGVCCGIDTSDTKNYSEGGTNGLWIGTYYNTGSGGEAFNGYIQDLRIYKGVAKYTGGFDVPRPYTPVGIATWRAVPDTTANNFATLNPVDSLSATASDGNLTTNLTAITGGYQQIKSNFSVTSGKWYWEILAISASSSNAYMFGISRTGFIGQYGYWGSSNGWYYYGFNGAKYNGSGAITYGNSYTAGDVIGVSLDMDNSEVTFYKNGVSQGVAFTNVTGTISPTIGSNTSIVSAINFGQNPTFSGTTTAGTFTDSNGKGLFKYQPPEGFLALCEDNLPKPTIEDPGKYFKTVLYTGDNNAGRSITGIGFTPDLVWVKSRTTTGFHNVFDSVRGATNVLFTNATSGESSTNSLISFNSDGFSLGTAAINDPTQNNVAWCWRAGAGTTSTNTNGSIPSVVSVNQDAGFSIVSYTGNGVNGATVGHGLGKTPNFTIVKSRSNSTRPWAVESSSFTGRLLMNTTDAAAAFSHLRPYTNTVLTLESGTTANESGGTYIAYCWTEIEGFSKFGSYVGNGSADGPFVYCGFKPALVILKIAIGGTENWTMFDNVRDSTNNNNNLILYPNLSNGDGSDSVGVDKLSNGFKIRNATTSRYNQSGYTYIFAAWAESPFQTTNSK